MSYITPGTKALPGLSLPAASITVDAVLATELRHTVPILPGEAFTTVGPVMFSALADGPFGMKHASAPTRRLILVTSLPRLHLTRVL